MLVEFRRKTIAHRTRLTNALTQKLKEYFPQALAWAGDLDTVMACDFLTRWPTLEKLQKARPENIRKFYQKHCSRNSNLIDERLDQIRSAIPLTQDRAVINTSVLMVQTIVDQCAPCSRPFVALTVRSRRYFASIQTLRSSQASQSGPRWHHDCNGDGSNRTFRVLTRFRSIRRAVTERSARRNGTSTLCLLYVHSQSFHDLQAILARRVARAYYFMQRDLRTPRRRSPSYKWSESSSLLTVSHTTTHTYRSHSLVPHSYPA